MKVRKGLLNIKNPTTGEWEEITAIQGESAYELAVRLGLFSGTEQEFAEQIASKDYVLSEIAKAQLDGGDVDLSGFATKDDLHSHSNKSVIDGISSTNVTNWNSAYTHSTSSHAPSNAQKNSDITKAEIESKLTGTITSHSHNYLSSIPSEYVTETELTAKGYATTTQVNAKANKEDGVYYIEGGGTTDTTNKVATWTGSHSGITSYYNGLVIAYKVGTAGSTTTTLNINDLGAVTVVKNVTTAISTSYAINCVVILTYTVDSSGTAYWKTSDYDSDTKTRSSNNAGKKMFIIGATSQSTSGQTTYSNADCYIGTDNCLYSGGNKVATESYVTDAINSLATEITNIATLLGGDA